MNRINSSIAMEMLLEISENLANIEHLQSFMDNMKHLGIGNDYDLFDWWETYLAWSETSSREDMEMYYGDGENE